MIKGGSQLNRYLLNLSKHGHLFDQTLVSVTFTTTRKNLNLKVAAYQNKYKLFKQNVVEV